jgi:hypothetical protein
VLGQRDLVEVRVLDACGRKPALRAVAVLQAIEDGALLGGAAELGTAQLQLGLAAVEAERGLSAARANAVHPGLCGEKVVSAARSAGGAARGLERSADREPGVGQHRLAAQALAETRGERLLGDLLVVLAQLAQALEAEVVALHLGGVVGRRRATFSRRWTDGGYPRPVPRALVLVLALAFLAGCGEGTVSNDDDVSRSAAIQTVERFLRAVHDGDEGSACAQLPGPQRGGLARISAKRGGPAGCEGALRTLPEYAPARATGQLEIDHDIGFKSALPHRSKTALDNVSIAGHDLPSVGLRREGDTWSIAVVCDCP